jgi:hypothetical protein
VLILDIKRKILIFIFSIAICKAINCDEQFDFQLDIPDVYYTIDSMLLNETDIFLKVAENDSGVYFSNSLDLWINDPGANLDYFAYFAYMFNINKYFSIPVFLSSLLSTNVGNENGIFFGSGLQYKSKYGELTGLIGIGDAEVYNSIFDNENTRNQIDKDGPTFNIRYYFFPKVNTIDYPLIGIAISAMQGILGLDNLGINEWTIKILSRSFEIKPVTIQNIELYYLSEPFYSLEKNLKIKRFGIKSMAVLPTIEGGFWDQACFDFTLDSGYRLFPDVSSVMLDGYKPRSTFYFKFGMGFIYLPMMAKMNTYLSFDIDHFPLPKQGVEFFY